jgi:osmotically-inducible protein OsmY
MVFNMRALKMSALVCGAVFSLCFMPIAAHAQDPTTPPASTAPDNSAKNKTHAETADQQPENTSDREITKRIRQSVIADKTLSTYGHNVKIITQGGAVTLKGPVHSEEEKQTIASKAEDVVGKDKVTNEITIKQ